MNSEEFNELIMGTEEAAPKWGISQDQVKRLCREGRCIATLVGKTWVLLRDQPRPLKLPSGRPKKNEKDVP